LSSTYRKLYTGEDMDSIMRKFDKREDDELFKQRKRITQHITSTVMRNLLKPQFKVPRANNVQVILKYADDKQNKKADELRKILSKFNGDKDFDEYMRDKWIKISNIDPNAFIILEWASFNSKKEKASPYPYEVYSENIMDFSYENKVLKYLIIHSQVQKEQVNVDRTEIKYAERYTLYTENETLTMTQTELNGMNYDTNAVYPSGSVITTRDSKSWIFVIFRHNLGFTPAIRTGYVEDEYTYGETMIAMIDDAVPILMKMVKANSELDLTMALHAFPQKIQYSKRCDHEGCDDGYLPEGGECPICKGTGVKLITSTQDSLVIKLPKDTKDIIDIKNLIHYVYPPVELVEFQDKYISRLTEWCKEAVYNTEIFSRKEIAETATGKNIDLQNVYDSLYTLAENYSDTWEFIVKAVAAITDMNKGLEAKMIFSKDFKMKSLNDLYNDLKIVSDSKADSWVKDQIQDDIARVMYHDNPTEYYKWLTKKAFYPFSGKTPQEIALALALHYIPEEVKTLYYNYGWLLDMIAMDYEQKNENFWVMPISEQYKIIQSYVKELIPTLPEPTYGNEDTQEPGETQEKNKRVRG
jgi:hypothetical protein